MTLSPPSLMEFSLIVVLVFCVKDGFRFHCRIGSGFHQRSPEVRAADETPDHGTDSGVYSQAVQQEMD